MLITTTSTLQGQDIADYCGIVFGEVVVGAHIFRDMFASIRDIFGGRSGSYEGAIQQARLDALQELQQKAKKLGANAIVGVSFDYSSIGASNSMFMVTATGTAVILR